MVSRCVWIAVAAVVLAPGLRAHAAPPFSSEDGRFTASFPDVPKANQQEIPTPAGKILMHTFSLERADGEFAVIYADYPSAMVSKGNPELILGGAVNGMITSTKATLIESKNVTQAGCPGREVTFSVMAGTGKRIGRAKLYLAGSRLYQVLVVEPESSARSSAANDFLKSFDFKPGASPTDTGKGLTPMPLKPFSSEAGQFSVSIPGAPTDVQLEVPTVIGNITAHTFMVEDSGVAYGVTYADHPQGVLNKSTPDVVLDAAVNGMITKINATVIETKKITEFGSPGRESSFSVLEGASKRIGRAKLILVGSRLYQVLVLEPEATARSAKANDFLKSFAIKSSSIASKPLGPKPLKTFSSDTGRFSVLMPGAPKEGKPEIRTPVGRLEAHDFAAEDQGVNYLVLYVDYPQKKIARATPGDVLDAAADRMIEDLKGTLIESKKILLAGTPGRDVSWSSTVGTDKVMGRAKLFLVSNRLYESYLFGPEPLVQSPAADKFLKSFKFQALAKDAAKGKKTAKSGSDR